MRGSLLIAVLLAAFAVGAARADEGSFEKKVAADPHGTVEISNVAGSVTVSGWDDSEVEVRGMLGAGAQRIDVQSDHGRTGIKVVYPSSSFHGGGTDLQVHVPRGSELEVTGISADVRSTEVAGPLHLKTVSGAVYGEIFQSDVEVKTVSGDVTLRGRGSGGSQLRVQTISGNIKVEHGAGDLEATTVSGHLTLDLNPTRNVRIHTTSGEATLNGKLLKGGTVDAETLSGDLKIHTLAEGALAYEVNTFSGDITNCMGTAAEKVSRYGPGMRLSGVQGKEGAGESRVRVKSMSGSVDLCDH
jgi:DUF4097 and DUF4098 domain-containing protein YvlB